MLDSSKLKILTKSRPQLAAIFEKFQQTPVKKYAESLYQTDEILKDIETILIESFREEFQEMGLTSDLIDQSIQSLQKTPVLQTSHHITPTNGPTFLTIDMISLLGVPLGVPYLVGANSGIPFSNSAWSGAISYGELAVEQLVKKNSSLFNTASKAAEERKQHGETDNRISLIPAKYRDKLLFGTLQTEQLEKIYSHLTDQVQNLFITPKAGFPYSLWATQNCSQIQNKLFDRSDIIYLDINQVIKRYLIKVLSSSVEHPIKTLLFDKSIIQKINQLFDDPNFFLSNYKGKKSFKVEPLKWNGTEITGSKRGTISLSKKEMIEALKQDELCPGLLLLFFILRFLNGIKCLGSFNQVEYLEEFRKKLKQIKIDGLHLQEDSTPSLTCGRLKIDGKFLHPVDLLLKTKVIDLQTYTQLPMEFFWEAILDQLVPSR